jgi:diguanylate cyclase (GGDEF)-like protein
VLVEVSRRISRALHPDDVVARVGGDEFAVLVQPDRVGSVAETARAIVAAVAEPIDVGDSIQVSVGISVGVAVGPAHDLESVLERADDAMYEAKADGGTWRIASDGDRRVADRRGRDPISS